MEPQRYDPITIVRASEVRGQLRFWWRASCGGVSAERVAQESLDNAVLLADMKRREAQLWGMAGLSKDLLEAIQQDEARRAPAAPINTGSARASQVQVEVLSHRAGRPFKPYVTRPPQRPGGRPSVSIRDEKQVPGYIAFPLQPTDADLSDAKFADRDLKEVLIGVEFQLQLTYPARWSKDVEAALWAWETFGGIGGRTRRGFGALQLLEVTPPDREASPPTDAGACAEWVMDRLDHFEVRGIWPDHVPNLGPAMRFAVQAQASNGVDAWTWLIKQYQDFRQQRDTATRMTRHGTRRLPTRNHWPEPDAIRSMTRWGKRYTDLDGNVHDHSQPLYRVEGKVVRKFPRAAFGLPIIFKFKKDDARNGDPPDQYTLTGSSQPPAKSKKEDHLRYGSPLILRPLICGKTGVALACVLAGSNLPPHLLLLAGDKVMPTGAIETTLTVPEAAEIQQADTRPPAALLRFDGQVETGVMVAFLKYAFEDV